jgi:hypothetical protein
MIKKCSAADVENIFIVINDAAIAYKGVIPDDRWHEPYMPLNELLSEIEKGVAFWGFEDGGGLIGVMGIQNVNDVTLIRHASSLPKEAKGSAPRCYGTCSDSPNGRY